MGWKINNKTPEELGVTVASWTDQALNASVLTLEVVQEDYTVAAPAELAHNAAVTLTLDGQQVFKGKRRRNPRSASPSSEGVSYSILDAFDELDRTVYQEEKTFAVSVATTDDFAVVTTEDFMVGTAQFEADELLGDRIKKVVEYAESVGVDIAVGSIASGIKWFRASYEDQMCGDLIRAIMRLMPEYVFWIDNTVNPPTANLKLRSEMESLSYDINAANVIAGHDIEELESERVRGVVIKYEIPVSVEGKNYTFPIIDSAGETEGVDVVVKTIGLNGAAFESEYARVVTKPIPQDDAEHDDQLKWWIAETPELANIADEYGEAELVAFLRIADADNAAKAVKKHTVKVVDDGIERPPALNPNVSPLQMDPVEHSLDATKYANQIIDGALPEWAGKRYRMVRATATIGVKVSELEAIADEGLKARFEEIFNLPKTFNGNEYLAANFIGEVMGTNAVTNNYTRIVSFDLNEPVPDGIATQLREQFNQRRFTGTLLLKAVEVQAVASLGKGINFTNGESAWSTMNEAIQSVSYDVASGEVNLNYGTAEQLGANDLRERLRATRINDFSHNLRSDKPVIEGVGGGGATSVAKFNRVGGGGDGAAEECILGDLLPDPDNAGKFKIRPGYVYGGGSNEFIEKVNITPLVGEHLYIEVSWTAEVEDGVLLTGGSMTSAEIKQGGSVPDDDNFTPASLTGKHRKALGTWTDDNGTPKWNRDGCGSYHVRMCSNGKTGSF